MSSCLGTGIVRDKQGRKMSKSLGNSPDPLELIEKYGADGVRVCMLLTSPAGNDLPYDDSLCEQGRNFSNNIWNAFRLVKGWSVEDKPQPASSEAAVAWMRSRIARGTAEIDALFTQFRISEALMATYKLIWDDLCSWYLESIKTGFVKNAAGEGVAEPIDRRSYEATVAIFEEVMKLLPTFMPFLSEEVWHLLRDRKAGEDKEVWHEAATFPGKLVIKYDSMSSRNGVVFANNTVTGIKDGIAKTPRLFIHDLLLVGFDVYFLQPELSCKILDSLGYDLNKVREDKFEGRDVYVVGAEKGNDSIPQFWIDKERLYMHRIVYKKGKQRDVVFRDYVKMEGYWVAKEVEFKSNGMLQMVEKYYNIKLPKNLNTEIFDPKQFLNAKW